MRDQKPDDRRGKLWFDCCYCDKTFTADSYNDIRYRAARHLNETHGSDLRHGHDVVEIETRDGHHVHENQYVMTRVKIYVTPFDILQPAIGGRFDYVHPTDSDDVCSRCGQRVTHSDDVEKIEDESDNVLNDDWTCSTCVQEQETQAKKTANYQLGEFAQ